MQHEVLEKPLVSIVVVTYNSSNTIVETLDSIYKQTYKNIELVISDDRSKDDTIKVCKNWLEQYGSRFQNTVLLDSDVNTGVSANLNRGVKAANGVWVKTLAGDDLLVESCIEECYNFCKEKDCNICMVRMQLFDGDTQKNKRTEDWLEKDKYDFLKLTNRKKQFKAALQRHILPGPGIFYTKQLWEEVGGFDESFRDFEEYSFELAVFQKYRVFFLDKPLVMWRQRAGSLTHTPKSPAMLNDIRFFFEVRKPLMRKNHFYLLLWDRYLSYYATKKIVMEEKSKYYRLLSLLSPLMYVKRIGNLLNK